MCTSDAGHPQKNAPIDAAVLYTNRWLDRAEQQAVPGLAGLMRRTPSDLVALYYSCRVYMYTFFFFAQLLFYTCNSFFCFVIFKPTTTTWKGSVRRVKRKLNIQRWLLLLPLGSFQRMSAVVLAVDADVNRSPFFSFLSFSIAAAHFPIWGWPCSIEKSASFKQCPHSPSFSLAFNDNTRSLARVEEQHFGRSPSRSTFFFSLCTRALCWVYNNLMGKISFSRKKKKKKS